MTDFLMPSLGADMEKGTVVEWVVAPGDTVHRGDVVALVDTDKGVIEIEIWHGGVVDTIVAPEGETVAVGAVLATLTGVRESPSQARRRVSPRARAVADNLGVDVSAMAGEGTVTEADVVAAVSETGQPDGMRAAIARTMSRSKQTIPHYYLSSTIDMTRAMNWLRERNDVRPMVERIIPAALLFKATALAVSEVPEMNGHFVDGAFSQSPPVHLGVAISLRGGGLVAPAIRNISDRTLDDVMRDLSDLVLRARTGRLREIELSSPSLTATNLGDRGVDSGYGVIIPPQVAIVCFGRIAMRPLVVDDAIVPRHTTVCTLSADHRVSDGHRGGLYLEAIVRYLQNPEAL